MSSRPADGEAQQAVTATASSGPSSRLPSSAAGVAASAELGPLLAAAMAQYHAASSSPAAAAASGASLSFGPLSSPAVGLGPSHGPREPGPPAQSPLPYATSLSAGSPAAARGGGVNGQTHYHTFPSPSTATPLSPLSRLSASGSGLPRHEPSPRGSSSRAQMHPSGTAAVTSAQSQQGSSPHAAQPAPLRSINPAQLPLGPHTLPPFLSAIYSSSRSELARYDALILGKLRHEIGAAKLRRAEIVVGIPFYTEVSNIHSVLVTMRDVFHRRKQRALFVVLGEFARQDCVQDITDCAEIERGEPWETQHGHGQDDDDAAYVAIETMVKPHPRYASKPWTVRALQIIASQCGGSAAAAPGVTAGSPAPSSPSSAAPRGAHLLIMDADIQFNHWELSASSLVSALLDPLQAWGCPPQQIPVHQGRHHAADAFSAAARASPPPMEPTQQQGASHQSMPPLPRQCSRNDPLYPSPMPLGLAARGGGGPHLDVHANAWIVPEEEEVAPPATDEDAAAQTGQGIVDAADSVQQEQIRASSDSEEEELQQQGSGLHRQRSASSRSRTTFSPVFSVRSPEEYPADDDADCVDGQGMAASSSSSSMKAPPPPACMVVLNAPRSFFADDAIVHLASYLHTAMVLGVEVHQGHGGEFALHRDLNKLLLRDETIVYDRAYCVEQQMAHRACFVHPQSHPHLFPSIDLSALHSQQSNSASAPLGCSLLEVLMKGKWHAKITLNKLLAFESGEPSASHPVLHASSSNEAVAQAVAKAAMDAAMAASAAAGNNCPAHNPSCPGPAPSTVHAGTSSTAGSGKASRARIDLVSEKLLNESLLWSLLPTSPASDPSGAHTSPRHHSPAPLRHHVGGPHYRPSPDPKAQSLRVLAPTSTRKQMVKSLKAYAAALLLEHVSGSQSKDGPALPVESRFVQRFLPLLQQHVCRRPSSEAMAYIVSYARPSARPGDPWHPSRLPEKQREKLLVFGPEAWASYTVELLHLYKASTRPEQRRAVLCAHRLVWLLGCVAFLNDHTHCLWGHMHSSMHQVYLPVFRRTFLRDFLGLTPGQAERVLRREARDRRDNTAAAATHALFAPMQSASDTESVAAGAV